MFRRWSREQLTGLALFDQLAVLQHQHALAVSGDDGEIVRDQQQCRVVPDALQQLEYLRLHGDVERRRGLIRDQEIGRGYEG